jgi:hypothetical protein
VKVFVEAIAVCYIHTKALGGMMGLRLCDLKHKALREIGTTVGEET